MEQGVVDEIVKKIDSGCGASLQPKASSSLDERSERREVEKLLGTHSRRAVPAMQPTLLSTSCGGDASSQPGARTTAAARALQLAAEHEFSGEHERPRNPVSVGNVIHEIDESNYRVTGLVRSF